MRSSGKGADSISSLALELDTSTYFGIFWKVEVVRPGNLPSRGEEGFVPELETRPKTRSLINSSARDPLSPVGLTASAILTLIGSADTCHDNPFT